MLRCFFLGAAIAAVCAPSCPGAEHLDLHPYRLKTGAVGPVRWEVSVEEVGKTEAIVRVEQECISEWWTAPYGRLDHQISVVLRGYDTKDLADGKPFILEGTFRVAGTEKRAGQTMFVLEPPTSEQQTSATGKKTSAAEKRASSGSPESSTSTMLTKDQRNEARHQGFAAAAMLVAVLASFVGGLVVGAGSYAAIRRFRRSLAPPAGRPLAASKLGPAKNVYCEPAPPAATAAITAPDSDFDRDVAAMLASSHPTQAPPAHPPTAKPLPKAHRLP